MSYKLYLTALFVAAPVAIAASSIDLLAAPNHSETLDGVVLDLNIQPVAGAIVTIQHAEDEETVKVTTDREGKFSAKGMMDGSTYRVSAKAKGGMSDEMRIVVRSEVFQPVLLRLWPTTKGQNRRDPSRMVPRAVIEGRASPPPR